MKSHDSIVPIYTATRHLLALFVLLAVTLLAGCVVPSPPAAVPASTVTETASSTETDTVTVIASVTDT